MKKGAIITAIVLLSAGLLIFVGGLFMGGSFRPVEAETKTYPVTEPFTDIHIETHETDIVFLLSTDGTCSVEGAETEKVHLNVSVENGALTVTTVDERTWVDRLIPHVDQPMQIRLPEKAYKTLSVESHTGDVTVPDSFAFEQVRITASTGDVTCGASSEDAIEITASTGDITLDGVRAKTASLAVSTGRITVRGASVSGDVIVSVSTGKIELDGASAEALYDPMQGKYTLSIHTDGASCPTLSFRIPAWANAPTIGINGKDIPPDPTAKIYTAKDLHNGDVLSGSFIYREKSYIAGVIRFNGYRTVVVKPSQTEEELRARSERIHMNAVLDIMQDTMATVMNQVNYAKNHGVTVEEAMAILCLPEEYSDAIEAKALGLISNPE